MKKSSVLLAAGLTAAMLSSTTVSASVNQAENRLPSGAVLTETGTVSADEVGKYLYSQGGVPYVFDSSTENDETNRAFMILKNGVVTADSYYAFSYLSRGYYTAVYAPDDPNGSCLLDADGNIVVERSALIRRMLAAGTSEDSDRYIEVFHATEVTDDKDACFIFATDRTYALTVEDGDTMYTGYAEVFDTKTNATVPGITITNPDKYASFAMGDSIVIISDDTYEIYDSRGTLLTSGTGNLSIDDFGQDAFVTGSYGDYSICSASGDVLFTTARHLYPLQDTPYFTSYGKKDSGDYATTIIDASGKELLVLDGSLYSVTGGVLRTKTDDVCHLYTMDGTEIASGTKSYYYDKVGFVYQETSEDVYSIYTADGEILTDGSGPIYDLIIERDDAALYVFADKDYTLLPPEGAYVSATDTVGVITIKDTDEKYTICNVFDGQPLSDLCFTNVYDYDDLLFALDEEGIWHIYEVSYR